MKQVLIPKQQQQDAPLAGKQSHIQVSKTKLNWSLVSSGCPWSFQLQCRSATTTDTKCNDSRGWCWECFFCFPSQLLEYTYRELAEVLRVHEITSHGCFRDASRDCIRNHDNAASAKRRQIRCLQRACKPRSRGSPERVHEAHQLPVLAHCSHRPVQPGPSVQNCRSRPSQGV